MEDENNEMIMKMINWYVWKEGKARKTKVS